MECFLSTFGDFQISYPRTVVKVVCLKTPINSKGDPKISKVIHKLGLVALPVMSSPWADLLLLLFLNSHLITRQLMKHYKGESSFAVQD